MATSVFFVNADGTEPEKSDGSNTETDGLALTESQLSLKNFWPKAMEEIQAIRQLDLKQQALPLARIKKIMKLDEDVKMISAEAPLLFAKAVEIFIHELTLRAWIHTEDNKRRTLQRNDIAMAIAKYDQFDFLIDIVPREDIKPARREEGQRSTDQVHYYFQLAQQHHANLQQSSSPTTSTTTTATTVAQPQQTIQIVQQPQVQTVQVSAVEQTASNAGANDGTQTPIILQTGGQTISQNQTGNVQIIQQIVTPSGEIQQIPIQLTPQQLQMIKLQLQGNSSQPVIIQAPIAATSSPQQVVQVAQQNSAQPVFITQASAPDNE
ncbi:nuclear transcription factor Y subunit gamma isoform X1 [Anthonomus grandis grandis]|uniref:nuclear transcription factor Y subunit gamma isoform X1 n=1 Tax=Anthonomus grandis grandis TaxID=2921223 RepID=UPI002165BB25|nr:nuclear transcription factor Y subunit gamma isoform X1 [Anthonomus grandis grandis]